MRKPSVSGSSRRILDRRRMNKLRRKKAGLADIATGFCMNGLAAACIDWSDGIRQEIGGNVLSCLFNMKRPQRFSRKLAYQLMLKMNPATMEMDFGNGRKVKLTREYMAHATGLPNKGVRVVAPTTERRRVLLRKVHTVLKTGTKDTQLPSMDTLTRILKQATVIELNQNGVYRAKYEMPNARGGIELDGCLLALQTFFMDHKANTPQDVMAMEFPRIVHYDLVALEDYVKLRASRCKGVIKLGDAVADDEDGFERTGWRSDGVRTPSPNIEGRESVKWGKSCRRTGAVRNNVSKEIDKSLFIKIMDVARKVVAMQSAGCGLNAREDRDCLSQFLKGVDDEDVQRIFDIIDRSMSEQKKWDIL
ncbi:uncharacterized protein LOC100841361 isoform X2 [Brachypodium distachyon]|uniref:uncharacterized protein LOC100841361 isoform X2 n=1 Tax=Brachypodium distachyon TaxID=15368 RepID=UPI00052FEB25|nr:uncharacterized protein LOC100841361 isoform X2 [Brachypodium distachyon]|eukprot:XP_014758026.1 uncharacterized protein LOC100841361 isoform X2 [Brachypodium distachyon]